MKIEHIFGSTVGYVKKFAFVVCSSRNLPKYIKTNLIKNFFKTQKQVCKKSSAFLKKKSHYNLLTDQISLTDCFYFLSY